MGGFGTLLGPEESGRPVLSGGVTFGFLGPDTLCGWMAQVSVVFVNWIVDASICDRTTPGPVTF